MTTDNKKHFTKEEVDSMCEWMDWMHDEMMKKTPEEREALQKKWEQDKNRSEEHR